MLRKWKALAVWSAVPYLCLTLIAAVVALFKGAGSSFLKSVFDLKVQGVVLLPCLVASGFGTLILWLLPIRRKWLGILVGFIMALVAVIVGARIDMELWGGFEENVGIFLVAIVLAGPSCAAGAYAGFLRSQDEPGRATPDDDGWWPSTRS